MVTAYFCFSQVSLWSVFIFLSIILFILFKYHVQSSNFLWKFTYITSSLYLICLYCFQFHLCSENTDFIFSEGNLTEYIGLKRYYPVNATFNHEPGLFTHDWSQRLNELFMAIYVYKTLI